MNETSSERRGQAYAKLLEGQRFIWLAGNARRGRTQAAYQNNVRSARQALVSAVELDPFLAEGYTALSELAISAPPSDIDEAIELAELAVKIEKNNYGARRILARLLTFKSGIASETMDANLTPKAIAAWKYITVLDPRNAEAWAFLSEFYQRQGKSKERIEALQKWLASATPLDSQFYQRITGGRESLSPENASVKLSEALIKEGRTSEAIEILSQVIADDPDNAAALDLLREAVSSGKGGSSALVIQALQQAVYANPGNLSLVGLLADVYARSGKMTDAAKVLRDAAQKSVATDLATASAFYTTLGDLYERERAFSEATEAYEKAILIRGLDDNATLADDERVFLKEIFQRMIRAVKAANRPNDVRTILERARKVFGKDDDFADRQLISFYRENGKRQEALEVVKALRVKAPREESLARLEATLLTELGRVDEAVEEYRKHTVAKSKAPPVTSTEKTAESTLYSVDLGTTDEFSNFLFISQLYSQANRTKEAIASANQAFAVARGAERRQIARLTLATAQQMSGDFTGAETTLRDILKESPGNPIALNNLGYFLLERNERFDEALKLIQEAVNVDPTNPSYLDSLGWAYFKLNKLPEAEKHLKEAARFDSMSSTIQEHLGDIYQKQGRGDLARGHWQKALELAAEKGDLDRIKAKLK